MTNRSERNASSGIVFFGALFVIVFLLPQVSVASNMTGNDNKWVSYSTACPGWGLTTEMAPSSTIQSYTFGGSNQLLLNQWGWQDNGATALTYNYDFYQFGQTAISTGTGVGYQIWPQTGPGYTYNGPTTTYYIGTAGGDAITTLLTGGNGVAQGAQWQMYNPSGQVVLNTYYTWPQYYNGYSLWNPIPNFQNVFVSPASTNTYTDFISGAGVFTYSGSSSYAINSGCNTILTGENSNMLYSSISCGSVQCTQNFNAPTGYNGHNTPPSNFNVQFGGGWGYNNVGVHKGDLLIATEATTSGSATFLAPQDTLSNTWTADGGGAYCSTYDCVEVWHAIANNNGVDTVTFKTSGSNSYTYGFLREFVGYSGAVRTSSHNSGTSGIPSAGSLTSIQSGDLVIAVAADTTAGWGPGQYYYMIGTSISWNAATEFGPGWQHGSTTATWTSPSGGNWAELAIVYSHP